MSASGAVEGAGGRSDVAPARVLLVGMMGSGKSTVGHALAATTGWSYLDNDELVRRATGVVTPEVLRERGEGALREAESQALGVALELPPPVIAGVAGGVVDAAADRDRITSTEETMVVWLRARIETLVERVGSGEGRPWLRPDPEAALRRLYVGREEAYTQVADLIVDVDAARPDEIADRILDALPR